MPCHKTSYKREDMWHLNIVEAPESLNLGIVQGKWVLSLEYKELTRLWHVLKRRIESEGESFGVIKMVCPPKHVLKCPTEMPEFHLYTSMENRKSVGLKLIKLVKRNIIYHEVQWDSQRYGAPACEKLQRYGA